MVLEFHKENCKCKECEELRLIELALKVVIKEDNKLFEELAKY